MRSTTRRAAGWTILASLALGLGVAAAFILLGHETKTSSASEVRDGGIARIALRSADVDSLDPALAYAGQAGTLLDLTCLRLLTLDNVPEAAAAQPRRSADGRTYTFRIRAGLRFSDGTPVRASAFARSFNRTLAPGVKSPWAAYSGDVIGAEQVLAGKATAAAGLVARGHTLIVRLKRPVPEFPARTTAFCAVPPTLPADPEGIGAFHAAGPYYVSEYRSAERVVLRRNRFYRGPRPQHVDGFDVDLRAPSFGDILDRIERGDADWGWAMPAAYLNPERRLVEKYGVNKSRFFLMPGVIFRGYALNTARPLFRDNPRLRQAVNFAIDRTALRRAGSGRYESRLTDQYLLPSMPGFRDAQIYPLHGPDLDRARELARGHTRGGRAVLHTVDSPEQLALAQSLKQNLAKIGLEVEIEGFPVTAYFGRAAAGEFDIGFQPWIPDFWDPYAVLNILLDGRFVGSTNWSRFDSPEFNRLLRQTALLNGNARERAYGDLDIRLARDAAPLVAVDVLNEATLVSARVGCVTRPFDLGSICLKR